VSNGGGGTVAVSVLISGGIPVFSRGSLFLFLGLAWRLFIAVSWSLKVAVAAGGVTKLTSVALAIIARWIALAKARKTSMFFILIFLSVKTMILIDPVTLHVLKKAAYYEVLPPFLEY